MTRFEYRHGAAVALVSAGPSYVLLFFAHQLLSDPTLFTNPAEFLALLPIALVAVPVGALIAFLPVLLGGLAMGYLGTRSIRARQPVIWAGAGAVIGTLITFIFDNSARSELALPFLLNGAICALIVRYGTRWSDDSD